MSQVMDMLLEEVTLGLFHLQVRCLQSPEDLFNMCQMFFFRVAKNDDII